MKKNTKTQDFSKLVKSIERSNSKFAIATSPQRIVMIAKDVLALLSLKRIRAEQGAYVQMARMPADSNFPESADDMCQLQDILKMSDMPTCSVCAIGAALVTSILRLNKVSVSKSSLTSVYDTLRYIAYFRENDNYSNDISDRARDVFPEQLMLDMEQAFENGQYGYYKLSSAKGRLVAIYQNLVDNKGKCFTEYKGKQVVFPRTR